MFRSEIGSGFEDPGGTPPPRIPRSTPPPPRAVSVPFYATFVIAKWIRNKTQEVLQKANFTVDINSHKSFRPFHHRIDKVSLKDKGLYNCEAWFWNSSSSVRSEADTYNLNVRGN